MKFYRPSFLLALIPLAFTGCQIVPEASPDPTRFFVLEDPAAVTASPGASTGSTIGMHEIRLPAYLADSRAIAVTSANNRVAFRDFERWAEPLDEGIERILQSALARAPGISRVLTLPFPVGVKRDYDVQISVIKCEGFQGADQNQVRFALNYSVLDPNEELIMHGVYDAPPRPWNGQSGDLARLLSTAIVEAADSIAEAIP